MKKIVGSNLLGQALLLSATLVWGSSFVILKQTLEGANTLYVIALRFLASAILLSLICIKKLIKLDKKTVFRGVVLGLILSCAYISQTFGLTLTTPGRNAFLTSSYCVMCPFLLWLIFKQKPKSYNVLSALLCIVGIGMIALSNDGTAGELALLGDGLTLISAVFFGLQIIFIGRFQETGSDSMQLLLVELYVVGIIHTFGSIMVELPQTGIAGYTLNSEQIWKIVYLTLACTLFAQFAQITGQKLTTTTQSSIILSLEAVFGVIFSIIFGGEKMTALLIIGFVIVFVAMMISELKPDFFRLFRRKTVDETPKELIETEKTELKEQKNE